MISQPERAESTPNQALTIEHLLMMVTVGIAAILRWGQLGRVPLNGAEAAAAWRVWANWQPAEMVDLTLGPIVSPAYFSLASILATFVGYSDGVMRFWPALSGLLLVTIVMIGMRGTLGRAGALIAGLVLAISPTLVITSRSVGGDGFALLAIVALLVIWQWQHPDRTTWAFGILGFGLVTSGLFFSGLVALITAYALSRWTIPAEERRVYLPTLSPRRIDWVVGGVVLLGFGTSFTLNMRGIDWAANLFVGWVGQINFFLSTPDQLTNQLFTLFGVEWLSVWVGLICAVILFVLDPYRSRHLVGFWVGAWLITLLQIGEPHNHGLIVTASALVVGRTLNLLMAELNMRPRLFAETGIQLGGLLIILMIIVSKNIGRYARLSLFDPNDVENLMLGMLCILIGLLVWGFVMTWDVQAGLLALVVLVCATGILTQWNLGWRIATWDAHDGRGHWQTAETVAPEFPLFLDTIGETARQLRGSDQAPTFFSTVDHPVLRWYLRDFRQIQFGDAIPLGANDDLLITASVEEPAAGSDYIGTDFDFLNSPADSAEGLTFLQRLRWVLFGESVEPTTAETLTFWVRSDLLIEP